MGTERNIATELDPRGLIHESYQIDKITTEECRSIFFDWAMGSNEGAGTVDHIRQLLGHYSVDHPGHPMTKTLEEGLGKAGLEEDQKPRRRGGWRSRRS